MAGLLRRRYDFTPGGEESHPGDGIPGRVTPLQARPPELPVLWGVEGEHSPAPYGLRRANLGGLLRWIASELGGVILKEGFSRRGNLNRF